jgi:AcrR family transcriptional regulator
LSGPRAGGSGQHKEESKEAAGADDLPAAGTPRAELERQRRRREMAEAQVREQILEAMLGACGELGYRAVTVKDVYQRYGGYRVEFYRQFANKAECYAVAYETEVERLWRRLARACETADDWAGGLRAALEELAEFVSERPYDATGLLVESHVAGGPAGVKRAEVVERLTRAVDGARRETSASRHSPPPITASFIVSAIEESVVSALARGAPEDFAAAVPALTWLAVRFYFEGEPG